MQPQMAMERWEHCNVFNGQITFYRTTGTITVPIKRDKERGDHSDTDAFNRVIAQLGQDGWQYAGMNGIGSWFKRRVG